MQLTSDHVIADGTVFSTFYSCDRTMEIRIYNPIAVHHIHNANPLNNRRLLDCLLLRFAVLDSPIANAGDESPVIVAMIVPKNRESDWIFCTESGHLQLLFNCHNVSRLIIIGNDPPSNPGRAIYKRPTVSDTVEEVRLVDELRPLLRLMHPIVSFRNYNWPKIIFFKYEDDVAYRVTVATLTGPIVGEFMVEDIELVGGDDRNKQLCRRLRFKRMPRVIQSEVRLVPIIPHDEATTQADLESLRNIENAKFVADTSILVAQYLIPMVAGLFLIASHLNGRLKQGLFPRALCLGIGGGVLLSFLHTVLGFKVTGVEADDAVLNAATQHFGLNKNLMTLIVADAIEGFQNFPPRRPGTCGKFDVVFVDLDSSEAKYGYSAPPPEFVKKPVFEGLRSVLNDQGVLIINVVPLNLLFYTAMVKELKEIFHSVHGILAGNQANYVVMATVSPTSSHDNDNMFLEKLKSVIPATYMDSIVKLL